MSMKLKYSRRNYFIGSLALLGVTVIIVFLLLSQNTASSCSEVYRNDIVGIQLKSSSQSKFNAEVATTDASRTRGLSGRKCIPKDQLMIFEFQQLDKQGFWMKDMKFPIDIIWTDASKRVVYIERNVDPATYPKILRSNEPALYVLEMHAGRSIDLGIDYGQTLHW